MFDLVGLESRVSRYQADIFLPRHKVSRQLIQEIVESPEPPPRPKPVRMKVNRYAVQLRILQRFFIAASCAGKIYLNLHQYTFWFRTVTQCCVLFCGSDECFFFLKVTSYCVQTISSINNSVRQPRKADQHLAVRILNVLFFFILSLHDKHSPNKNFTFLENEK